MENKDQITALAREYAEETGETSPTTLDIKQRNMERHLEWLSQRYCLVEKSKVEEEYKRAIETNQRGEETGAHNLCTFGSSRRVLLESLFPEIAKVVES